MRFQALTPTEVCGARLTPVRISLRNPEERAVLTPLHRLSLFLARAATTGSEQELGHVGPCEGQELPPATVPLAVSQQRAGIMFSGITGAVVTSEEGLATSAPSYGLVKDVLAVVDALPAELFDRHAEHRPCGLLDKYGAVGTLIGDVLGLPLMPWVLAEPIGKAAAKLPKEIAGEVKKKKKALKRRGADPSTAEAAVLCRRVPLTLPSADEIKAAWKRVAKAKRQEESAAAPAAAAPAAAAPSASPAPESAASAHECSDACSRDLCPRAKAMYDMATSQEASVAIAAAFLVYRFSLGRCNPNLNEKLELAQVRYRHALRRLQCAYPGELCGFSQNSAREMVDWAIRVEALAGPVPAARAAARKVGFDFDRAVSDTRNQLEMARDRS
jgi:hypothetical protein